MDNKLYYGCAYYPELWEETEIIKDIEHMKYLGINVVRMGEFAWSTMEPNEGQINLEFFIRVIKELKENGIDTIFCTPTATPPVWVTFNHPERCFKNQDGEILSHGARQHCCTNEEYVIQRTQIIVEEIAKQIGVLEGVIGWQIDNEFKCHVAECYCESCKDLWHKWLADTYKTMDNLNEQWGTDIWSQYYHSFDQVPMPVKTPFLHNASLVQAYKQFSRDYINRYCHMQADIIRRYSPMPITHNSGEYFHLDNPKLFDKLDFASFDDYASAKEYQIMLRSYDYFRMVKKDRPFWVMETSPNHNGNLMEAAKPHPVDYLKAETASAYLSGAAGFSYWLFRQQRTGCELPHGSILYAWGKPTTGYEEVKKAGLLKDKLEPYIQKTDLTKGRIALMYSDLARVSLEVEPLEHYDYWKMIQQVYEEDIPHDVSTDLIHEGSDLDGYEILYTPFMACITSSFMEKAITYVKNGGTWITGPLCNYRTKEHTVPTDAALGQLEEYAKVNVKYMVSFTGGDITGSAFGQDMKLSMVGTILEPAGAKPIGVITSGEMKDEVFITQTQIGKGQLVLLGSHPEQGGQDDSFMRSFLMNYLNKQADIGYHSDKGIKTIKRVDAQGKIYLFGVDMEGKGGNLYIEGDYRIVLGKSQVKSIWVEPYETALAIIDNKPVISTVGSL